MMVACVTGYKPGVFTHFVANEQIYDRHMDNAHEMLARADAKEAENAENGTLPAIILKKESGCKFEDITLNDFEIVGYNPMKPQLKFELGI